VNVFQSTSDKLVYRSVMLAGNFTAWNTEFNLMDKCQVIRQSEVRTKHNHDTQEDMWERYNDRKEKVRGSAKGKIYQVECGDKHIVIQLLYLYVDNGQMGSAL